MPHETGAIDTMDTNNIEHIIGFDALDESMRKCKKNVSWKGSVGYFLLHGLEECIRLEEELKNDSYAPKPINKFKITSPKEREVLSIVFRDRVYQRSVNDNDVYPNMTKHLIAENCACQQGKGTDYAIKMHKDHLRWMYRRYKTDGWILKIDIKGYYQNIRHDTAKARFKEHLSPDTFELVEKIIDEQYSGDVGFYPGSQMIQIAGIAVPEKIDWYIKHTLQIKCYMRYMDDLVLMHPDKEYLERCRDKIGEKFEEIGLKLHPKKTFIQPITDPLLLLGYVFRLTDTGKVLMKLDPANVKREQRKLRRAVAKAKRGEITRQKVNQMYSSWRNGHADKGDNKKMIMRMDQFYKNLWRE